MRMTALRQEFEVSLTNEHLVDYFLVLGNEKIGLKALLHLLRGTEKRNLKGHCKKA